ncbi:hypothetical protein DNTS_004956 [Danionella cerebrum]|uniref:Ig-like domain-containing protein n=1 Tax=Danionella cerebrum TaxID=2873325 RepID=A0A553PW28_9TELE|nr:hypothetical protein DNTS_004956 [Danionella translucida]
MNSLHKFTCFASAFWTFFLLQGSNADKEPVVHKAVGSSLELKPDHPKDSLTLVEWQFNQNTFAEYSNEQIKIKDVLENVKIIKNKSGESQRNICIFHLRCEASGHSGVSFIWSGHQERRGADLDISLRPAERATLTCTANNTLGTKNTTETLECSETTQPTNGSIFSQKNLMVVVGVSIASVMVVIIIFGTTAVLYKLKKNKGKAKSEADITIYDDVNTEPKQKKRSESVVNGAWIYETVDDVQVSKHKPQTVYDTINFERTAPTRNLSSPYQEVL